MGVLPTTTTVDDFSGLIRIEKDKQHVHTQDEDWSAVEACIMEVEDSSRRQARLGKLVQITSENCMACEERMRSINHAMNIVKGNGVKRVQQQENTMSRMRHKRAYKRHGKPYWTCKMLQRNQRKSI